ncbi:MAG TPA: 5-formyltetrahydrofolate cyclo-ligase [Candidatus Margulisiibacteriota bacterium]|nr:5-formyltetrahydrofolate cyclo-ligase [Candidatus Margulisiibacteriota bacterium]
MNVEKRAIRQRLREQRRALTAEAVEAAGWAVQEQVLRFAPYTAAVSLIAYITHENELPTAGLLRAAERSGRGLFLPRSTPPIGVVRWQTGEPLVAGCGGVYQPADGRDTLPEVPGVALVPVVGWDATGQRLGRGGGFYDRLFAALTTGITRVGLAYEFQLCPELPRDPWDIPLDYVITERRTVRCERTGAALQKGGLQLS